MAEPQQQAASAAPDFIPAEDTTPDFIPAETPTRVASTASAPSGDFQDNRSWLQKAEDLPSEVYHHPLETAKGLAKGALSTFNSAFNGPGGETRDLEHPGAEPPLPSWLIPARNAIRRVIEPQNEAQSSAAIVPPVVGLASGARSIVRGLPGSANEAKSVLLDKASALGDQPIPSMEAQGRVPTPQNLATQGPRAPVARPIPAWKATPTEGTPVESVLEGHAVPQPNRTTYPQPLSLERIQEPVDRPIPAWKRVSTEGEPVESILNRQPYAQPAQARPIPESRSTEPTPTPETTGDVSLPKPPARVIKQAAALGPNARVLTQAESLGRPIPPSETTAEPTQASAPATRAIPEFAPEIRRVPSTNEIRESLPGAKAATREDQLDDHAIQQEQAAQLDEQGRRARSEQLRRDIAGSSTGMTKGELIRQAQGARAIPATQPEEDLTPILEKSVEQAKAAKGFTPREGTPAKLPQTPQEEYEYAKGALATSDLAKDNQATWAPKMSARSRAAWEKIVIQAERAHPEWKTAYEAKR
jgi:hypothetical protein